MFFKVLKYDVKNGFVKEYKKFVIAFFVFLVVCIDFYFRSRTMCVQFNETHSTFSDYIFYIFKGIKEFKAEEKQPFEFPALWMLVMLLILYIVLYYPYKDLMGYGKQVLINSRSRGMWWLSKCGWLIICVTVYFVLLYTTVFLFCAVMKVPLSLNISEYMFSFYTPPQDAVNEFPLQRNPELFLMPLLLVISTGILQMFLSLIIRPLYSYCCSVALMLLSAYYLTPLFPGNYAMLLRNNGVVKNGVNTFTGVVLLLLVALLSAIGGYLIFQHYDILNKEQS